MKFEFIETDFEKKMIERILLFKNEIIDHSSHSSKSVNITQQLIECFNNVINDDELIEDLHMVSRGYDQFFMKNIFTELEQVKLQINFMEISSEERPQPQANTNVMSTFMQSMSTFENPNNANKTEGLVKKEVLSEKTTEAEKFYKKMKRMVIVAPADMTFESLGKFISRKITNYNELESNYCKRSNNVYVEQHSYRDYEQPSRVNHFSNPFLKSSQRLPRTIEFLNNFHKMKFNSKKGKFGANTLSKRFGKVEPFNFGILINKNKEAEKNEEPAEQQPQENEKLSSENYDGENEDGENDDIEHEDIQNDGNDHDDIEDESNEDEDSEDDHDIDDDDNDDHDHDEDDDDEEANKYFEDDESEEDNPSHSKGSQKSKPIIHQIPIYEEMDDEDSSDEIDNIKIAKMPFMDAENDDMMIIPDEPVFPEIEFDDEDRIIFEPPDVVKIEPSEIVNTLPKQPLKGNFTIDFTTPRSEPIDGKVTIGNWVKQNVKNIKMKRVPDSFLSGFSQYRLRNANMLQFSLKEVSEDQLNKDENSEEDIDFGVSNFFRGNRVYEKYNRTYSLFLQKIDSKEQSIQIRELHRLLEKELQSSQIIKDEI